VTLSFPTILAGTALALLSIVYLALEVSW